MYFALKNRHPGRCAKELPDNRCYWIHRLLRSLIFVNIRQHYHPFEKGLCTRLVSSTFFCHSHENGNPELPCLFLDSRICGNDRGGQQCLLCVSITRCPPQ